jgi:hypothetical protein
MIRRTSLNVAFGAATVVASTLVWIACGSSTPTPAASDDGGGAGGSSSGSPGAGGSGSSSGVATGSSSGSPGGSSGGSSSGSVGGSSGGSSSGGSSSGGSTDAGASCPQVACPSGETCCADLVNQTTTCSSSCAANDIVACTGSADCAGSTDGGTECCATAILNKGPDGGNSFPHGCTVESVNSYCGQCNNAPLALGSPALTCQTNGDASVEYVHVCTTAADCTTESSNTLCCPVFSYNICLSQILATIGGVTCMQ